MERRKALVYAALAAVVLSGSAWTFPAGNGEIQRIEKQLADLAKRIEREEAQIARRRPEIQKIFLELKDSGQRLRIVQAMKEIETAHRDPTSTGSEAAAEQTKRAARDLVKRVVSPDLESLLGDPLGANMVDLFQGHLTPGSDLASVLAETVQDLFPESDFDQAFDKTLKPMLFPRLAELLAERSVLERKLAEAKRREESLKAGIPAGMVEVSEGKHQIGINDKDLRRFVDYLGHHAEDVVGLWRSTPEHQIELQSFFIDVNEVTCAWYAEFLKDPENEDLTKREALPRYWDLDKGTYLEGWENRPVTDVTPMTAARFAAWMGRRLPTEQEWEAAARADRSRGEFRIWPWGDTWSRADIMCNNDMAHELPGRQFRDHRIPPMMPVGSFPQGASALGINDLAGNAFEITSSPYQPFPGFKPVRINRTPLTASDFPPDRIVIRGGDANKRDIAVSTIWRFGLALTARSSDIGFRTAASTIRGKDEVARITEGGALRRYMVDVAPVSSDKRSQRPFGALDDANPQGYTSMTTGGFDLERMLPSRAKHITLIRRDADCFNNLQIMRGEAGDRGMMIALLKVDFPVVEPALEPGTYFVMWRNSHTPPEPEKAEEPSEDGDKPARPSRPARPQGRGKEALPALPDAFEFVRLGGAKQPPVRLETFPPVVVGPDQPVRMMPRADSPELEVRIPFSIRFRRGDAMIFTFNLKLQPEIIQQLR